MGACAVCGREERRARAGTGSDHARVDKLGEVEKRVRASCGRVGFGCDEVVVDVERRDEGGRVVVSVEQERGGTSAWATTERDTRRQTRSVGAGAVRAKALTGRDAEPGDGMNKDEGREQ